jgi:hypothetical protein
VISSPRPDDCCGQATVELIGSAAFVLLTGLVALQLLAAGYAAAMADNAAEAAALAIANGRDPVREARAALPGWPARAVAVRARQGRVGVELSPPSPLGFLRRHLRVSATATVREPPGAGQGRSGDPPRTRRR